MILLGMLHFAISVFDVAGNACMFVFAVPFMLLDTVSNTVIVCCVSLTPRLQAFFRMKRSSACKLSLALFSQRSSTIKSSTLVLFGPGLQFAFFVSCLVFAFIFVCVVFCFVCSTEPATVLFFAMNPPDAPTSFIDVLHPHADETVFFLSLLFS